MHHTAWREHLQLASGALAIILASVTVQFGCATEEEVLYGDPARVAGGTSTGTVASSSGSGEVCTIDSFCSVSWSKDIYGKIFDAPKDDPQPTGACSTSGCHAMGTAGFEMPPGDPDTAYASMMQHAINQGTGSGLYVVPCRPELSRVMCNLAFDEAVDNPYVGDDLPMTSLCGSPMPKLNIQSDGEPLSQQQLDDIATWIKCGAPNN